MSDYDKIDYWVEISEYDLETAKAMLQTKRFLYVGFMCHQSVEKMLKANYVKVTNKIPPYVHGLKKISVQGEIYDCFSEEQIELLATLEPFNIEGRYPVLKMEISKMLDKNVCQNLIKDTEELIKWIKNKLSN